ncbi:MAG: phage tail protein [Myxococcales bacterium]|nr:phage tail protein [Myxococcales bacterium]
MEGTIGEIRLFAGNFAPRAWAFCNGQLLPIAQNQALFSILGTTYGGDGQTTFALPDLRGRAPIHAGQGPGLTDRRLGVRGGSESLTLTPQQLPSHTHAASATVTPPALGVEGDSASPAGAVPAKSGQGEPDYHAGAAGGDAVTMAPFEAPVTVQNTGGNQPFDKMPPFIAMNYIICLQGIFPSRG